MALCLILPIALMAQTKVAVYVTSTNDVPIETRKVIGSEVVAAFVATEGYSAIERTAEFLSGISQEQAYQRGGSVDDSQICELGRQFGVDLVCVTDVTKFKDQFYIQARLIDVEKATVLATAREISVLSELDTVIQVAQNLAKKLVGTEVTYTLVVENTKGVALDIYVGGEFIGPVPSKTTQYFQVRLSLIGRLEAKSKGLFGKFESKEIKKMKAQEVFVVTY